VAISSLVSLPIKAANTLILGKCHCAALELSELQHQKIFDVLWMLIYRRWLVLAMVLDRRFWSGHGSELNWRKGGGPGLQ